MADLDDLAAAILRRRVEAIDPWFHSIELPHGITTPGAGQHWLLQATADIYFAMGISGLSVLDVGAWDGYFSFAAERRGAQDVLAVDHFVWQPGGVGSRAAFDLCREALHSKVRDMVLDLPHTTREAVGEFDIVLFNGIIYHIVDPIYALLEMARIARQILVVETWIDNLDNPRAVMNFFPAETMPAGYPQNGWGPNSRLMHALLRHIGFETVLEWPSPGHDDHRSIFIAFRRADHFAEFVQEHAERSRPRLVGAEPTRVLVAPPPADPVILTVAPELIGWRQIAHYIGRRLRAYVTARP